MGLVPTTYLSWALCSFHCVSSPGYCPHVRFIYILYNQSGIPICGNKYCMCSAQMTGVWWMKHGMGYAFPFCLLGEETNASSLVSVFVLYPWAVWSWVLCHSISLPGKCKYYFELHQQNHVLSYGMWIMHEVNRFTTCCLQDSVSCGILKNKWKIKTTAS